MSNRELCPCSEGDKGVCPECWKFKQLRHQHSHSPDCERPRCDGTGLLYHKGERGPATILYSMIDRAKKQGLTVNEFKERLFRKDILYD